MTVDIWYKILCKVLILVYELGLLFFLLCFFFEDSNMLKQLKSINEEYVPPTTIKNN